MNVTGRVWRELTRNERLVVLKFTAEENRRTRLKKRSS